MRTGILLSGLSSLLLFLGPVGCDDADVGPPARLSLLGRVTEFNDKTAVLRAAVEDEMQQATRASGELTWRMVEGAAGKYKERCAVKAQLLPEHFRTTERDWLHFEVKFKLDAACPPPSSTEDFLYGFVSLKLPDGRVITDSERSLVPSTYGGANEMNFPANEARLIAVRAQVAQQDGDLNRLLEQLGRVAKTSAEGVPLGQPCPAGLVAEDLVLLADHRVLLAIAEAHQSGAKPKLVAPLGVPEFEAVNCPEMDVIIRWLGGDRKQHKELMAAAARPRSHMAVIQVQEMRKPYLPGLDSKSKTSKFEAGVFSGEVWVVALDSGRVLCREKATARSSEKIETRAKAAYNSVDRDFTAQVGRALREARERVAPGLTPAPPGTR